MIEVILGQIMSRISSVEALAPVITCLARLQPVGYRSNNCVITTIKNIKDLILGTILQ